MSQENRHKLRLKLPNGTELEAEGSAEFVYQERKEFLASQAHTGPADLGPGAPPPGAPT